MKFYNFHLMPFGAVDIDAVKKHGTAWVTFSNSHYDAEKGADLYHDYLDQLEYAVPELSVHENGRIYKFVGDAVQSAVTGSASAKDALASAQQQADRVLRAYK